MRSDHCQTLIEPISSKIVKVLHEIERIEKEWVIADYPRDHSYGRIPGENEIRLWSIPASTGLILYSLVLAKKPKLIVEIGTSAGYSTIWMGAAARTYGGLLHTLEICPEKMKLADENVSKAGLADTVNIMHGNAVDITRKWDPELKIDFVFLDADKENYLTYLNNLLPFFSKDAILCADNAIDYRHLMTDFIDEVKRLDSYESLTLNLDNGLLLMTPRR